MIQQTSRIILMCNQVVTCNRRHTTQEASWLVELDYKAVMSVFLAANSPARVKNAKIRNHCIRSRSRHGLIKMQVAG